MAKPPAALIIKWRDLAESGWTYAKIQREHPQYSANQVRHCCQGTTGWKLPGPRQKSGRWGGKNPWLQGERSPHARLTTEQAIAMLDDWDEERGDWGMSGAKWARRLGVSVSTIHMLRRGENWKHLDHPNQGRKPRD